MNGKKTRAGFTFRLSARKQQTFLSGKSVSKAKFVIDAGGLLGYFAQLAPFPQFNKTDVRFLSASSSGHKGSFRLCLSVPLSPVQRAELKS